MFIICLILYLIIYLEYIGVFWCCKNLLREIGFVLYVLCIYILSIDIVLVIGNMIG